MTSETVYSVELVSRMTYPEREFLTGHLYGHPAPKRAVDPSNDGGVSVQRPACGRQSWLSSLAIINCAGRVRGHHEHASRGGCLTRNCHLTVQQTRLGGESCGGRLRRGGVPLQLDLCAVASR